MKIAFVGSRNFCDKTMVELKTIEYLSMGSIEHVRENLHELVSGGAPGVDKWAEAMGRVMNTVCWIMPADWIKHGRAAGAIRNQQIVDMADHIVAFWDGESKGTKITIDMAIKAGKPVDVYIRRHK